MIYHFCLKEQKLKNEKLEVIADNKNFVHIRNLKQIINHGLILKKLHRVIEEFPSKNLPKITH